MKKEQRKWDIFFEETFQGFLPENAWVLEFSETDESTVTTAPIEDGSFSAYNKIAVPRRLSVKVGCEGSEAERGLFEGSMRIAKDSLDTFWITSPTQVWHSMTIEGFSKSTVAGDGVFITIFDVEFVEVIQVRQVEEPMSKAKQVQDPTTQKTQDKGNQPPKNVSATVKTQLSQAFEIGGA